MNNKTDFVRQSYSDIAQGKEDTILFASQDEQTVSSSVGYSKEEISLVPEKANMGLGLSLIHIFTFSLSFSKFVLGLTFSFLTHWEKSFILCNRYHF